MLVRTAALLVPMVLAVACDQGAERRRLARLEADRERLAATSAEAASRPPTPSPSPPPMRSEHAYADVDREIARLREERVARESAPARIKGRQQFAERYQKQQRCEYAGVTGPRSDLLQSSQCFGEPSLAFSRPLFDEARSLGFSAFRRYEGVGCCLFDFDTNQEMCRRGACPAAK